jgi:biuret amidohydrolase
MPVRAKRRFSAASAGKIVSMTGPRSAAVLALHWQVNVIKPEGFFGGMLAEPVARSGVVDRAAGFHAAARSVGAQLVFTRFTVPEKGSSLVRNTGFMRAVGDAQEAFRPNAPGAQLIPEMSELATGAYVADNQKLSGLAGNAVVRWLLDRSISTVYVTGVATNLTVEQTARHGTDLGFTVYVVSDCVTAAEERTHEASLANLELTTAGCLSAEKALAQMQG